MLEQLIYWEGIPRTRNQRYSIVQVLDDENGLKLSLLGADNKEYCLDYSNCCLCMYRNYEETFYLSMLDGYIRKYGQAMIQESSLFEALSSEDASKIEKMGIGSAYFRSRLLHLILFADTSVFETVSYGEPELYML